MYRYVCMYACMYLLCFGIREFSSTVTSRTKLLSTRTNFMSKNKKKKKNVLYTYGT